MCVCVCVCVCVFEKVRRHVCTWLFLCMCKCVCVLVTECLIMFKIYALFCWLVA